MEVQLHPKPKHSEMFFRMMREPQRTGGNKNGLPKRKGKTFLSVRPVYESQRGHMHWEWFTDVKNF